MNVFAKFDEIPSMILQDIKETKRYGHTHTDGRMDGQRVNSITTHKHSLRGGIKKTFYKSLHNAWEYLRNAQTGLHSFRGLLRGFSFGQA